LVWWPRCILNFVMKPYAVLREIGFSSRGVSSRSASGYLCSQPICMVLPMHASGTRPRSKAARQVEQIGTAASPSSSGKHILQHTENSSFLVEFPQEPPFPVGVVKVSRLLLPIANGACCYLHGAFVVKDFQKGLHGVDFRSAGIGLHQSRRVDAACFSSKDRSATWTSRSSASLYCAIISTDAR
jgi:hypothetical protein